MTVASVPVLPGRDRCLMLALLVVAFLYPIIVCAIAFPTPYIDIVELRSWGLNFPLYTWKHPPLQTWVIGAISLLGPVDAWLYMLAGAILNVVTLVYLVLIARDFFGRAAVQPLVIIAGGSAYLSGSLPTIALNADQLQAPLWAGLIYHAMRAARDNCWRDWLAMAVLLALSFWTKYFVVVLVASLIVAAIVVPPYRRVFGNAKLYVAVVAAFILVLPYLLALRAHPEALGYSESFFSGEASRIIGFWNLILPPLFTAGMIGIAALWLYRSGRLRLVDARENPHARFLLIASLAFALILCVLIAFGLDYTQRYSYPFAALAVLICLAVVQIDASGLRSIMLFMLGGWILLLVGTTVYAVATLRSELRDPAPAAAAAILARWNAAYKCGPAYVMGAKDAAFRVAFYSKGPRGQIIGVSIRDYLARAQWVDRERIRKEGAVVVDYDEQAAARLFARDFPHRVKVESLSLPFRRTTSKARRTYYFCFIPPDGC